MLLVPAHTADMQALAGKEGPECKVAQVLPVLFV